MSNSQNLKSEIDVGMLMSQVDRLCTKKFSQNAHKLGMDITQDQWIVLGPIWKQKGISQKEIAEYCGKDKTSVTKIIDTLEKKNLLVRYSDQIDQRIKRVVLSGINSKEVETFKIVLKKIYNNLISE